MGGEEEESLGILLQKESGKTEKMEEWMQGPWQEERGAGDGDTEVEASWDIKAWKILANPVQSAQCRTEKIRVNIIILLLMWCLYL